jgi:hypothetical protein
VIWDYELHDGLVLNQEKSVTFFLSFKAKFGGEVRCWSSVNSDLSVIDRTWRNVRLGSMLHVTMQNLYMSTTRNIYHLCHRTMAGWIGWSTIPAKAKKMSRMDTVSAELGSEIYGY